MLNETQTATLRAAMDRIIPADDFPGAWDAGVGNYLSKQWEGDLKHLAALYRDCLDALEAEALHAQGLSFFRLSPDQQDRVLKAVEEGKVQTTWPHPSEIFFGFFVQHVMEGYYSDPGNGGNKDAVSWKMLGYKEGHRGS